MNHTTYTIHTRSIIDTIGVGENKVRFYDDTYTDKIMRIAKIGNSEFFDILTEYSHQYEEEHPEEKLEIEELLAKIKTRLNLD